MQMPRSSRRVLGEDQTCPSQWKDRMNRNIGTELLGIATSPFSRADDTVSSWRGTLDSRVPGREGAG